jgi:hypothetical protein
MMKKLLLVMALLGAGGVAHADKVYVPTPTQERVDSAGLAYTGAEAAWERGTGTLDEVYVWSVRWLDALRERDAADKSTLGADADAHLARMKTLEANVAKRVSAGLEPTSDQSAAAFYRAEAQLWDDRAHGK